MRRILHIDMDAFFAAVEEKRNPALKGKPVVIGGRGDPTRRGVVSTADYEARKYGIHSGMPLRTAFKLCPSAIFLPVDCEAYAAVSRRFKKVLVGVTPIMEDVGIDEAFLDISALPDSNEAIAAAIKAGIYDATGLTCSIGIAPNKLLAKIASDMRKPDGLTILTDNDIKRGLWPLPIRKLHGIGPKTEENLKALNVETIGQLAQFSLETLVGRFGHFYGHYLHDAARGIDDRPVVTHREPKSFSREETFQEDVRNWQAIARTIAEQTKEVVSDLVGQGYGARTVTVKIRYSDFRTITRSCSVSESVRKEDDIRRMAFSCLKRVDLEGKKVRLVGVRVGNIKTCEPRGSTR
ncbi:MAG: DNA polymerase IV [Syntrophales bacterium]|jgi:DNA polymerase-4|nr:DNA polymerase IV [Syntrophales bacterium]MCK9527627.1 DNA polymerase IV [Syntrophales bacterium]MDX9922244.1 DNA polymerase IV [Syntrophales bacterium]